MKNIHKMEFEHPDSQALYILNGVHIKSDKIFGGMRVEDRSEEILNIMMIKLAQ